MADSSRSGAPSPRPKDPATGPALENPVNRSPAVWSAASFALALGVLGAAPARAGEDLVAARITAERFDALRVGGPDADAGVGDWALQNGTICAAVSAPERESALSSAGGVLVDLGHCGADNDQWSSSQPLLNADRSLAVPVSEVEAAVDADGARLVTRGGPPGLSIETTYRVDREHPDTLFVHRALRKTDPAATLFSWAELVMHASAQLRPFSLLRRDLSRSIGFAHPGGEPTGLLAMLDTFVSADALVLVGSESIRPRLAYGIVRDSAELVLADGRREPLPTLTSSGEDVSILGVAAHPYFLGRGDPPGLFAFAQMAFLRLGGDESIEIDERILVGHEADVASVTDALFAGGVTVTGTAHPATRLHVFTAGGAPVTEVRPDETSGAFSFVVPPGSYRLAIRGDGFEAERDFDAEDSGGGARDLGALEGPDFATVRLPQGTPMRLVFLGVDGTPDPAFGDDGLGVTVGGRPLWVGTKARGVSLAGVPGDPEEVSLRPGRYRVLASRGLEFDLKETALELSAGDRVTLEIAAPERVVQTPGWIAADLHVHSAESFDSALPLSDQVRAFASMGGEVLVMSEHDRIFDPAPVIAEMGLAGRIANVVGVEVTSAFRGGDAPFTIGHLNALPVPYDRLAFRGGAPNAEGRRLRDVLVDLRRLPTAPFVQLNHPRDRYGSGPSDGSYFTHLSRVGEPYDPTRPLEAEPNRALIEDPSPEGIRDVDYDGVELLNGPSMDRYRLTRADWFSLLRQGVIHTGTANSDTHRAGLLPAMPRNYVPMADDDPAAFDSAEFQRALRQGRSIGTSGPFLSVHLDGAGPGERIEGREATLVVRVDAAPWVPVSVLRVFVDGAMVHEAPIAAGGSAELPLDFAADAFVTVEAHGEADETYAAITHGYTPFAFSNPVFVDADGDGVWTPPGMSGELPPTMTDPLGHP